jgi:hypothetical protein
VVVALLVLIVLILLFGAGVVKGWIANVVGYGCGGLAILAALLWVGSFFGEHGFMYVVYGILGLLLVLGLLGKALEDWPSKPPPPPPPPGRKGRLP